jgi:hypothetical protein
VLEGMVGMMARIPYLGTQAPEGRDIGMLVAELGCGVAVGASLGASSQAEMTGHLDRLTIPSWKFGRAPVVASAAQDSRRSSASSAWITWSTTAGYCLHWSACVLASHFRHAVHLILAITFLPPGMRPSVWISRRGERLGCKWCALAPGEAFQRWKTSSSTR